MRLNISIYIICNPKNPIVFCLPWFELHNPRIDWKKHEIIDSWDNNNSKLLTTSTSKLSSIHISTISLQRLRSEATIEDMFVFVVVITLFSNPQDYEVHLPPKYQEFSTAFDKVKVNTLLDNQPYDCPIDLHHETEPPWGLILTFRHHNWNFFKNILMRILRKGLFDILNLLLVLLFFSLRKDDNNKARRQKFVLPEDQDDKVDEDLALNRNGSTLS